MNSMFGKYLSLLDSLLVTAICMGIVFLVLIIIAYILSLFEHIPKNLSNTHKKNIGQETINNAVKKSNDAIETTLNPEKITDENMVIAMLVASMEAAEENDGAYIKIRNIKEI